jgi:hypothetical protein
MDMQDVLIRQYTQISMPGMLFTHEKEKKKKKFLGTASK